MPRVFISYRREEAADMSGRIADFLDRRFGAGTVFRDVNAILAGSNFVKALQRGLDESSVVLVLIGLHWIHLREPNGMRRIDSPNDFVRYEVAAALRAGKLVIPILINGATLPTAAELPLDLAGLAERPPFVVRNDPYFADDMTNAIAAFRSAVAWAPSSVGVLSVAVAGVLALVYFVLRAARINSLPHYAIIDFLMFIAPNYALIFSIIRSARTQRWLWLSVMLAAGLAALLGAISGWPYTLYVINLPNLLLLLAFGLYGPRQPYRSPTRQRPTHRGVFTVFWVSLLAFAFALAVTGVADSRTDIPTARTEADVGFAVTWGLAIIGNIIGLPRAWQTRSWAWLIIQAALAIPSLVFAFLGFFTDVLNSEVWGAVIGLLFTGQIVVMGIFSWWGPRAQPAPHPASHPAAPVAVQQ